MVVLPAPPSGAPPGGLRDTRASPLGIVDVASNTVQRLRVSAWTFDDTVHRKRSASGAADMTWSAGLIDRATRASTVIRREQRDAPKRGLPFALLPEITAVRWGSRRSRRIASLVHVERPQIRLNCFSRRARRYGSRCTCTCERWCSGHGRSSSLRRRGSERRDRQDVLGEIRRDEVAVAVDERHPVRRRRQHVFRVPEQPHIRVEERHSMPGPGGDAAKRRRFDRRRRPGCLSGTIRFWPTGDDGEARRREARASLSRMPRAGRRWRRRPGPTARSRPARRTGRRRAAR